jgi:hypothetical protein
MKPASSGITDSDALIIELMCDHNKIKITHIE